MYNRHVSFLKNIWKFGLNHRIISTIFLVIVGIIIFVFRPKTPTPPETRVVRYSNIIQSVSVSGSINAKTQANLSFPISGKLVYIGAKKGQNVSKYQTIAALDQRTIEDNIQSAVKSYQSQKISFDITNDFNGNRDLSDTGLSVAARRQLQAALNALDQTQINLEIQKIAKEQAFLISPIDGILVRSDAEVPGVNVGINTTYIVVDPASLVFSMDVDEADISKVNLDQLVKVDLDSFSNNTFNLKVSNIDFVSHITSNGGNAFTVETKLASDSAQQFRIGMNGNAEIITAQKENVLVIPISSIANDSFVYVKTSKGFKKVKVILGLQNDIDSEVKSGLYKNDIVAVQPNSIPPNLIIK